MDDLHERAGSSTVLHLHGELNKARSSADENYVVEWTGDQSINDTDPQGYPMRPHIVWFGEAVPLIETAARWVSQADKVLVVGTSMQVYPAAGLVEYAPYEAERYLTRRTQVEVPETARSLSRRERAAARAEAEAEARTTAETPVDTPTTAPDRKSSKHDKRRSKKEEREARRSKKHKKERTSRQVSVRSGDTLEEIAKKHGTTVAKLRKANKIKGDRIKPGEKLRLK